MQNNPPYTITLKAADYLTKIAEAVTQLELGTDFKRDIRLHRQNRVRSIYSSLAIEGNTLTLGEVTAVIEGKLVASGQEEIKEVKNAFAVYDKIMTFDPYRVKDFLKAHKLMADGLVKESGKFRSGDVGVFDGDVVVHVGAKPQFVPQLIEDLFSWAKESELHPVLKGAVLRNRNHPSIRGWQRSHGTALANALIGKMEGDLCMDLLNLHYRLFLIRLRHRRSTKMSMKISTK